MKNIQISTRDYNSDIKSIILEKNNPTKITLTNKIDFILERYEEFKRIIDGKRITTRNISENEKNAYLSLYNSKTKTAKEIIQKLTNEFTATNINECPYCGIGKSDEMDHFLPKELFSYYSILEINLIPVCSKCNKIKGEELPGLLKDFLHIYFDKIPNNQYLKCEINEPSGIPVATFKLNFIEANPINERISKHYSSLNLLQRFSSESNIYILRLKAMKTAYGKESVIRKISMDLIEARDFYGQNHWKHVLCDAILNTGVFESFS